jgi:hypothetical protein
MYAVQFTSADVGVRRASFIPRRASGRPARPAVKRRIRAVRHKRSRSVQALQPDFRDTGAIDAEESPQSGIPVRLPMVAVDVVAWCLGNASGSVAQMQGCGS